jgi:muramoyltetrapeptide carboxypeptidase
MTIWPLAAIVNEVAIFSPSSSPCRFPRRQRWAEDDLKRHFSSVIFGPGWERDLGGQAGTAQDRAEEFMRMAMLSTPSTLLMASTGGGSCSEILAHVEFSRLSQVRPRVCGYSDTSALLLALLARSELGSFHGPSALPTYGEAGGADIYSHNALVRALHESDLNLVAPAAYTGEFQLWDKGDNVRRRRMPTEPWQALASGSSTGVCIAANLEVVLQLFGTEYFPRPDRAILFLEDSNSSGNLEAEWLPLLFDRGLLDNVVGLVLGRSIYGKRPRRVLELLAHAGSKFNIPVLVDVDFGHTDPKMTLPVGADVYLDADAGQILVTRYE